MILPFLLFLASFIFLLSSLPASLPNGIAGFGVTAAWTMNPVGPANLPLPILLGKAALFLLPFGNPAFRLNLAGALLIASTLPLAYRLLTLTKPRFTPGPTLMELDDERRWATLSLMGIALWGFSPAFVRAGTAGIEPALFVFFPIFVANRYLVWRRRPRSNGGKWIRGILFWTAAGLWLTLDWRWVLILPAMIPWQPEKTRPRAFLYPSLMGLTLAVAFLVPWITLSAFQVATLDQLVHLIPSTVKNGWLPVKRFSEGDLSAFFVGGGLLLTYALARALKKLWARFPRGVPSALLLFLLAEGVWFFLKPTPRSSTESRTNDLFRSLPAESALLYSGLETGGTATYAQRVLGKRRDIQLFVENGPPARLSPGTFLFREPTEKNGDRDLPLGFVLQPLDFPLKELSSPLAQVSLGRVPLFLAETQAPSLFLAQAHRRLGDAFASLQIPDQAEEEFLIALAMAPQDKTSSENLGRLLMDYGDGNRAKAALIRASRENLPLKKFK